MTRRPGALAGRIAGDPETQKTRSRRQQQKRAFQSGDNLGRGLKLDALGRFSLNEMSRLDPADPAVIPKLIQLLIENGYMEK